MRRLPRISARVSAAVAGAALCVAVAVLAATGVFGGSTKHATTPSRAALAAEAAQRVKEEAVQRLRAVIAAERAKTAAAMKQAERDRGRGIPGHVPGARYSAAARIALRYLGVPYVWGAAKPSGFDASGLVKYVYAKLGVSLPQYTVLQYGHANSVYVPRSELKPGDLVFFDRLGHVGIYIGENEFIDAPHTGAVVRIESLTGRYSHEYYAAKRILS